MITQSSTVFKINMKRYIRQPTYSYIIKTDVNCFLPSFVSFETSLTTRNSEITLYYKAEVYLLCSVSSWKAGSKRKTKPTLFNWKSHFE